MSNKILSTLNIGNNSYEIDDAFARQKIEEVDNNLSKINPVYSTSGSVVSFDNGADNLPLEELIVDINPVQDLHGYDHPWIGGCGNNLWGGKKMADDIINVLSGAIINETANTISIPIGIEVEVVLTNNITFKENTRYTYILSQTDTSSSNANLMFVYTDGTNDRTLNRYMQAGANVSAEGKTVAGIMGRYYSGTTVIKYEESGLFEGILTVDAFEPYENICPITGWTGMNVQKYGKNFFDNSVQMTKIDCYSMSGSLTSHYGYEVQLPSGEYIISYVDESFIPWIFINIVNEDGSWIDTKRLTGNTGVKYTPTITLANNQYLKIFVGSGAELVLQGKQIQIEQGSVVTDYEPYIGETISINWELEGGTVYKGNLDVLNGILTVNWAVVNITSIETIASDNYIKSDSVDGFITNNQIYPQTGYNTHDEDSISDKLKLITDSGIWSKVGVPNTFQINLNQIHLNISNTLLGITDYTQETRETAKIKLNAYLTENPIKVMIPIRPITYQLNKYRINSFLGQNNIFTNINSKNILVTYKGDIPKSWKYKLDIDKTAYRTTSIPYGEVDKTSTSTNFTATIDGITELRDGVCVILKNGVVTSANGFTININNLGAKPVYSSMAASTRETTVFNSAYTIMLIYSTSLNNGDGGWWFYRGYNSDTNTTGYVLRTNSMALPLSSHTHRYRLLFTSADGTHFVPANNDTTDNTTAIKNVCQEKIDPFGTIRYYNGSATLEAEGVPSGSTIWEQNTFSLGYSFNRVGGAINLAIRKPVYIKALPQSDGSAIIDADEPYVQDLPTTEDGFIYIYLGSTYSASNMELTSYHPVYHYHNGAIRQYTGTQDITAANIQSALGYTPANPSNIPTNISQLNNDLEFIDVYEFDDLIQQPIFYACDILSKTIVENLTGKSVTTITPSAFVSLAAVLITLSPRVWFTWMNGAEVEFSRLGISGNVDSGIYTLYLRGRTSVASGIMGVDSTWTVTQTSDFTNDYKSKTDALWTDYQSALIALDGGE